MWVQFDKGKVVIFRLQYVQQNYELYEVAQFEI